MKALDTSQVGPHYIITAIYTVFEGLFTVSTTLTPSSYLCIYTSAL